MYYREKTITELEEYGFELHSVMRETSNRLMALASRDSVPARQVECLEIIIRLLKSADPYNYPFADEDHIEMHG